MCLLVSGRHVGAHLDAHQHGASIHSSVNLCNTLPQMAREWKKSETWFLGRLFILQLSTTSQILELIYWKITIFSFDHMTDENREYHVLTHFDECATFLLFWTILTSAAHFYHFEPFLSVCRIFTFFRYFYDTPHFYHFEPFLRVRHIFTLWAIFTSVPYFYHFQPFLRVYPIYTILSCF